MNTEIVVSICIVNWNTAKLLQQCLSSIYKNIGMSNFEVLVVDNNSADNSVAMIQEEFPDVKLIINKNNVGYARANNQMLRIAQGEYSLLLNSDTIVLPDSVTRLINFMEENQSAGACGPKLFDKNLNYQISVMNFPTFSYELRYHLKYHFYPFSLLFRGLLNFEEIYNKQSKIASLKRVDVISGASFLVRKEAYKDIGLMSESYFLYSEENDWCWRMQKKGWGRFYVPSARIIHLGGQSTKKAGEGVRKYNFYLSRYKFFKNTRNRIFMLFFQMMNLFFWGWLLVENSVRGLIKGKRFNKAMNKKDFEIKLKIFLKYFNG